MLKVRNRLVFAVLLLNLCFEPVRGADAIKSPADANSSDQSIVGPTNGDIAALSEAMFKVDTTPDSADFAANAPAMNPEDTVVIPFPTTFWTGLSTLVGLAIIAYSRRAAKTA